MMSAICLDFCTILKPSAFWLFPFPAIALSADVVCASSPRLHFHHICGTDVDTSANATAQCGLALEMSDGHFYQLDASNKFFDFATDDPDKVSHHYLTLRKEGRHWVYVLFNRAQRMI